MRYFQPKEYEYVSQYTPAMMELDYRKGQELLKQEDAFNKELFDATNNYIIKNPGHLSKQEDVDKANNYMKTNIDNISKEVYSGKIKPREAINKLNMLTNHYKSDSSVQGLLMDSQATWGEKGFESQRSTGKLKNGVGAFGPYGKPGSLYIDESNQLHVEKANASELKSLVGAGAYGIETPKDPLEKYKDFYSYVKPETIAEEIERAGFKTQDGQNYIHSTNTGTFTKEQVTRQALRNLATPYVESNIENAPQFEFDRRRNMTDVYGFDNTKEKTIDNIVDSFPGYYKKELTKDEEKKNPFGTSSDKSGKTKKTDNPDNLPEDVVTVINSGRNIIIGGKNLNNTNAASTTKAILDNRDVINNNVAKKAEEFKNTLREKDGSFPNVITDPTNEQKIIYNGKDPLIYAQVQEFNANTAESMIKQNQAELITQAALDVTHDIYPNFNPLDISNEEEANKYLVNDIVPNLKSLNNAEIEALPISDSDKKRLSKTFSLGYKTNSINVDNIDEIKKSLQDQLIAVNYMKENGAFNTGNAIAPWLTGRTLNIEAAIASIDKAFEDKNKFLEQTNPGYSLYSQTLKNQLQGFQYRGERSMIITDESSEGEGKYLKTIISNTFSDVGKRSTEVVSANTTDNLKEFWEKYDDDEKVREAVQKAIQNKSRVRGDIADNEWVLHLKLGVEEGLDKPYELEIKSPENQTILMKYAEGHGYDADYFKVMTENKYGQTLKASDGVYGIINSYAPDKNGFELYTRTVTTPRTVDGVKLEEGQTVFTLPQEPGYLFRVNSDRNKMFLFHNDMDEAVITGNINRQNEILQNIAAYGIEPIYNKKLADQYSRDVKLNIPAVRNKTGNLKSENLESDIDNVKLNIINQLSTQNNREAYTQEIDKYSVEELQQILDLEKTNNKFINNNFKNTQVTTENQTRPDNAKTWSQAVPGKK